MSLFNFRFMYIFPGSAEGFNLAEKAVNSAVKSGRYCMILQESAYSAYEIKFCPTIYF